MKTVLLASNSRELNGALKARGDIQVVKILPYSDKVLQVVQETRPQVVVLSLFLPGDVEPAQLIYDLTSMEDYTPQLVVLAGNTNTKEQIIDEVISSGVYDIVFNPETKENPLQAMLEAVLDRILNPRNRGRLLQEIGVRNPKQAPKISRETLQQREQDSVAEQEMYAKPSSQGEQFFDDGIQRPSLLAPRKQVRPYIVGVYSPGSSGSTFIAQNVAAALALNDYHTALIDMDGSRKLHYWFGRDNQDRSFEDLFENKEINGAETSVPGLDAFTSKQDADNVFRGDVGLMEVLELLTYETIVLDFSSAKGWRPGLLLKALQKCDEVLVVADMDYAKAASTRKVWDYLSQSNIPIRVVLNKWDPDYLPCEERDLTPLPPSYYIPVLQEVYQSIVYAQPLVVMNPSLIEMFLLKDLAKSKAV